MTCHACQAKAAKFGRDRYGNQRYRCKTCRRTFGDIPARPLGAMRLPQEKAETVLAMLLEGCSIRSTERLTGVHRDTIMNLLVTTGERCERFLESRVQGVSVRDVQADEIWAFVGMKEKTKKRNGVTDNSFGDAYCFVGLERHTKLVLAWHLGRRSGPDTFAFTEKLYRATVGHFQLSTDGFNAYPDAVIHSLGTRVDYAQLIKIFGTPVDGEHRYSPPEILEIIKTAVHGNPDLDRLCTAHVERANLSLRMGMRRLTRLTNAFSKKWSNLRAAYGLFFAWYNFCRVHSTLRVTPAMESGLATKVWTVKDLLVASTLS